MRTIAKDFFRILLKPTSIIAAVLLTANACVLMSILGIDFTLAGHKVMLLSRTTVPDSQHNVTSSAKFDQTSAYNADTPEAKQIFANDTDETNSSVREWKTVRMRVTAYCPCRKCCGRYADGRTACMHRIRRGDVFVAADKKYSFGTKVIVPGYNRDNSVKVMDRGRVIRGNRLDVFFNSHRRARKWGTKYLDVKIKG